MKKLILLTLLFALIINPILMARIKVAALFPSTAKDEPWKSHAEYIRYEANRRNIDLTIFFADYSHDKQYKQVERAIADVVDSIILVPVDYLKAGVIVDRASMDGKKVVTYNQVPTKTRNISMHIAFDYNEIGVKKAQYMLKKAPKGNYIVFMGSPTDYISSISYDGTMRVLSPYIERGDITILANRAIMDGTYEEALSISTALLEQTGGEINAAILPNDYMAKGVIEAIDARIGENNNVQMAGEDVNIESARRIVTGKQDMSILLDTRMLAVQALEIAQYLGGTTFVPTRDRGRPFIVSGVGPIPTYYVDPTIITRENIDRALIESGLMRKKDVYTPEVMRILKNREIESANNITSVMR